MPTRRDLLIGGAAGVTALGFAALGYRAWDRGIWATGNGNPYAPWSSWDGQAADGLKRPLRAAILAASPHNTQPWLFRIADNTITVFADRARNLGTFDPFRREMHLGIGALVENLVLAARAFGATAEVKSTDGRLMPSPADTPIPVAQIVLTPTSASRESLFNAIPNRHTNRGPYLADQAIGKERLQRFADLATTEAVRVVFVEDAHARAELGAIIVEATERIVGDPQMSADSASWFRAGRRDIEAHRDGVIIDTSGASPLMAAVSKVLPDLGAKTADRYWLSMTRDIQVGTARVIGVILVRDRLNMHSAIEAGRAWQRLHLAVTSEGLAAQPLNQPIEWIDRAAMLGTAADFGSGIAQLVSAPRWEPTFVFRLGSAERAAGRSPRRALEEVLGA
jgi:nitroreductase